MRITWLGFLNFVVLQWFFIRLARITNSFSDPTITIGWKILAPITPLSGWWNDFVYLNKTGGA